MLNNKRKCVIHEIITDKGFFGDIILPRIEHRKWTELLNGKQLIPLYLMCLFAYFRIKIRKHVPWTSHVAFLDKEWFHHRWDKINRWGLIAHKYLRYGNFLQLLSALRWVFPKRYGFSSFSRFIHITCSIGENSSGHRKWLKKISHTVNTYGEMILLFKFNRLFTC